jgi:hypothetical protein
MSDPVIKRCECRASYTAKQWRELRAVGVPELVATRDGMVRHEYRACGLCRDEIYVEVDVYDMELGGWAISAWAP